MKFAKYLYILPFFVFCASAVLAQDRPVGNWRSHLPYNSAIGVATDGNMLYTVTTQAFFTFEGTKANTVPVGYSKVEGMSDIGMQCVAYDITTSTTVLVYADGNIDLYKEKENTFYNIPDLKIKSVSGSKAVNQVYTENGIAYVCTSIGILVVDLSSHKINENYLFYIDNQIIPVTSFTGLGTHFYAATTSGLYRAPKNSPQLQNFAIWELVDTINTIKHIATVKNQLFLSDQKTIFALVNDTLHAVYTSNDTNGFIIQHIDAGNSKLLISEFLSKVYRGAVKLMDANFNVTDSFTKDIGCPLQAVQLLDSTICVADLYHGLDRILPAQVDFIFPDGPNGPTCFDIYAYNKNVWVAHGGFDDKFVLNASGNGVSNFNNNKWKGYKRFTYHPFDALEAFVSIVRDEATGTVYMGSFETGLFSLRKDATYQVLNKNSIFEESGALYGNDQRQLVGQAIDKSGNLWVTSIFTHSQLYVKDVDDNWAKFYVPAVKSGGPVTTDNNGQVWFVAYGAEGVIAYNPNGTPTDASDDAWFHFTAGAGSGNLPSNKALCIAKDNNNNIWVGTDNGICIISNCRAEIGAAVCDAQIPIVQYDQFAGYLFSGNNVNTIAVDGGNRKWIGTDDGVWLLSPSADRIIYRYTVDNSPLPSNHIRKIAVDPITGDVYMGTDVGMVSFRSTATDASVADSKLEIFPNPVAQNYLGTIAIKGIAANSDVRITDIDGQLVYRTTAAGGQAVWNGKDYTGHRPQSGVYLVFVSSSDGSKTYTGKIVFMQ